MGARHGLLQAVADTVLGMGHWVVVSIPQDVLYVCVSDVCVLSPSLLSMRGKRE
jgi:hypothetical protein